MREQILAEIRRLSEANAGQAPGLRTFENETGIRRHDWLGKYWPKWSDAVVEAGFRPQERTKRLERSETFQLLSKAIRHFGREPTRAEFDIYRRTNTELPWYQTLLDDFGSKSAMIESLRQWATSNAEYSDIVALLPDGRSPQLQVSKAINEGYVYLIKSGAFYKIGRGDELEKRVKQIRTALPDASELVHSIRTDDPPGIEAYWHRRFDSKRANGEWFKLSIADVAAFRRRKTQ